MIGPATESRKIRYAVVGLGYFAQGAVLPAFSNARENSELAALVSDDPAKLAELGEKYGVAARYSYEEFDRCLESGGVDAVYIVLPNSMHCEYSVKAAEAGVHVLCEKPMAVTEQECGRMIRAAEDHGVKLMVAYRLHFEETNLRAIELVNSGKIGEPRLFQSTFTMQVKDPRNIRLQAELGGGTLYDIGVYCINAARYLFRSEPLEAVAFSANSGKPQFREVDEMTSAVLRFPGQRLAAFTTSFGAADVAAYRLVGTRGDLRVDPAYHYEIELKHAVTIEGRTEERVFPKRDQIAPELLYFSDCILRDREPEPSGLEGLADVRVVRALYRSAASGGRPVKLGPLLPNKPRPSVSQNIRRPPVRKPRMVRAKGPRSDGE